MTTNAWENEMAVDWLFAHDPLLVDAWPVDGPGFAVDSDYAELFWLPQMGPSSLWMLRRLARSVGRSWSHADLAQDLGLGKVSGRNAPFIRTLSRLLRFRMVRAVGDTLQVRTLLSPVNHHMLTRVSTRVASLHPSFEAEMEPTKEGVR